MKEVVSTDNLEKSKKYFHDAMKLYEFDKNKALEFLEKSIHLNPNNSDALYNIGIIYSEMANFKRAIELFEKALEIKPKNESILYNLSNQYFLSNQFEKALEGFEKIIAKNPRATDAMYNAGYISLLLKKDYTKAIDYFNKVLRIDELNIDARFNLALALSLNEEKEKSQKVYEDLLKLVPDHFPACFNLAVLYKEFNRKDKALIMFKKYINLPNKSKDQYSYIKYANMRIKELENEISS